MVSCDLCGASPTGANASSNGTDAEAGAHAPVQRRHRAPARTDAGADADASPNGGSADADASSNGARADAGVDGDGAAEATVPLGWVVSVEAGGTRTYCETCARQHLRSIEAKLDSEWW